MSRFPFRLVHALAAAAVCLACGDGPGDPAPSPDGPTATVELEIAEAPADAGCLRVSAESATRSAEWTFDVTPGSVVAQRLEGVPVGDTRFEGRAYAGACAALAAAAAVPTWKSEPAAFQIVAGRVNAVRLVMRRHAPVCLGVEWDDETLTCGAVGDACASAADCCSATCDAGRCRAAAGPGPAGACGLAADPGPCAAVFVRWAFDLSTGSCSRFVYGGCGGNANNFETLAACERACRDVSCTAPHGVTCGSTTCRPDEVCVVGADGPVCRRP